MGTIARPTKTLGNREYVDEVAGGQTKIKAAEVDADLDTIYALCNGQLDSANIAAGGILNTNINAGAAIAYSKLNLANGIVNADVNTAAAIAGTKLAVGASINAKQSGGGVATVAITNVEGDIAVAPSITTRGGTVFIMCNVGLYLQGAGGTAGGFTITLRLLRGATEILKVSHLLNAVTGANPFVIPVPVPAIMTDTFTAGSYVYKLVGVTDNPFVTLRTAAAGFQGSIRVFEMT